MNRYGYARRNLHWVQMPHTPAVLDRLVLSGSGKDLELCLALTGGVELLLPAHDVRVATDSRTVCDVTRIDDVSLSMHYSGPDLRLVRMRAAWPDADDFGAEVAEELHALFASVASGGGTRELNAVVRVEVELRGAAPVSPERARAPAPTWSSSRMGRPGGS